MKLDKVIREGHELFGSRTEQDDCDVEGVEGSEALFTIFVKEGKDRLCYGMVFKIKQYLGWCRIVGS